MRPFFSHLEKVIDKHYFFGIKTARDLEYFAKGSIVADMIYNQKDHEALQLGHFNEFVRNYYKVAMKKDWGEIVDFYCGSDISVFDQFKYLTSEFKKYYHTKKSDRDPGYLASFKPKILGCTDFAQLMKILKVEYADLNIREINQFDKFYLGILSYGDSDKGEAHFGPLKDKSFVYLHDVDNPFKHFVASEYKIFPVLNYRLMIEYISGNNNSMELFFQLYFDCFCE